MKKKYKKYIERFLFVLVFFIFLNNVNVYAELEGKTILVIGSYDIQNEWEEDILQGFTDYFSEKNIIKVEYLDSDSISENKETYYRTFSDFLNVKYKNDNIDYVFFMDDEALDFGRSNLFNSESCLYRKQLFFVGVNKYIYLSEEEKKYIYGIGDLSDNSRTIDIVLATRKNLKNLYLILNNSTYCNKIKNRLNNMKLSEKGINVNIITTQYIDELKRELLNSDLNNAAIILCSTYNYNNNDTALNSKEVIKYIKSFTKVPIYSTLYKYIEAGAIGGVVNDGEKLGNIGAQFLERIRFNDIRGEIYYINRSENILNNEVFNFKAIREYNINPLDCPANSIFLYKGKYDLLLPNNIIDLIWIVCTFFLFILGCMFYSSICNKKAARTAALKVLEAEEREKIKTNYIMIMSHEFRTPLNIIQSVSELLLVKVDEIDCNKEYFKNKLQSIIKNSNRINKMINDFIDVSKLDSEIMVLSLKMYNIIQVVEDTAQCIAEFVKQRNVEIVFDTDEEEIFTALDKREFQKVILKLFSNSVKNMENGGRVNVTCNNNDNCININIQDNGKGIDKEKLNCIFDKFYQGNESYFTRSYEGNGIGLYIVKKIIELHDGTISIESEVGRGTLVSIRIPLKEVGKYPEETCNNDELEYLRKIEFSDM